MFVHFTVSPAEIVTDFGLKAKSLIDTSTVFPSPPVSDVAVETGVVAGFSIGI